MDASPQLLELKKRIAFLEGEMGKLLEEVLLLRQENAILRQENAKLKEHLGLNSRNSSLPPSRDLYRSHRKDQE